MPHPWERPATGAAAGFAAAMAAVVPLRDPRSIALAERRGAVRDGAAPRNDPRNLVFRHPAPEALP